MRQQHLQRAATGVNVCIYCACHLGIEPALAQPSTLARSALRGRRQIFTSSRWQESSGAASATGPERGGFGIGSQLPAEQDGGSGLSPAEQAEKANRLRQREEMLAMRQRSGGGRQVGNTEQHTQQQKSSWARNQTGNSSSGEIREDRDVRRIIRDAPRIRKFGVREDTSPFATQNLRAQENTSKASTSISESIFGKKGMGTSKGLQNRQGQWNERAPRSPVEYAQSPTVSPGDMSASNNSLDQAVERSSSGRDPNNGMTSLNTVSRREMSGRTRPFSGGFPAPDIQEMANANQQPSAQANHILKPTSSNSYRSIPLDSRKTPEDTALSNGDQAASWQHLRRRNEEPSLAENESSEPQQQPADSNPFHDETWVDRSFEEHQRKRAASLAAPSSTLASSEFKPGDRSRPSNTRIASKRCARCGELGHIARQCPRKSNSVCHACGQPGHLANRCPNKAAGSGTSGSRVYLTDPFAEGPPSTPTPRASRARNENPASQTFATSGQRSGAYRARPGDAEQHSGQHGFTNSQEVLDQDPAKRQPGANRRNQWTTKEDDAADEDQTRTGKSSRREQWAGEDEGHERTSDRRTLRRNRRNNSDEDDEGGFARDQARARKQARQEKKEADKKAAKREREVRKAQQATPITLPEFISVQNLSQMLGVRYEQFVEQLENLGYDDVFPGKVLNMETSGMIAMEYNFEPSFDAGAREEEERDLKARPELDDKEFLPVRPPVVTIMGHVDHGKTTILDYLRKSSVAAGEAGGITQHIGAFSVPLASSGKTITFLDTPGHAAFLAMRQRGANVTDIVILVVAADDSVKPQTLEAIKHAKTAGVPMIVAINKIDKEEADVQRCKQDLARHGVEIEDYGGETQVVEVSGKTGRGMDDLEETVVTLSEILDHRAESDGDVEGWVLEATTKKAGRVATVLVRRGTLRPGSIIVAGKTWARVKTLRNEGGRLLEEVGPGMPVEVDGWKDQPAAGDEVLQASSERKATSVVEFRLEKADRDRAAQDMEAINEARRLEQEKRERGKNIADGPQQIGEDQRTPSADESTISGQMEVPFIIKADVSGSVEAVSAYILGVSNPLIAPKVLHASVGAINESDIELASVAQGHILAFNLRSDPEMKASAEARGVKVLENNIIYRVLDDVKAVLEDKLPPIVSQKVLGEAEVAASFEIGLGGRKKMKIAGCKVRNGVISKGSRVRVTRKGDKVYDGTIGSLKNVKKEVQEMRKGSECGIGFEEFESFEVGDQIQTYEEISEKRKL